MFKNIFFIHARAISCPAFLKVYYRAHMIGYTVASSTSIPLKRMYSYNRVNIIGYQTQPVEVRQTPQGTSVTDLNLVVPYGFTSENGEHLTGKGFHTVTVWGGMADVAGQYVRPGSQLFISGRLQTDSWEDEQSGDKRSKTKIIGMDMIMLDPKDGQFPHPENAPQVTSGVNRAEVVGNLTKDPEVRTTTSGQNVVSLGVATNERWRDKASGEDRERTEFHNIVIWGPLGTEVSQTLKKGNRVYVAGRVQTRSWETQAGQKRYTTEIIADQVQMLGTANPSALDSVRSEGFSASTSAPQSEPTQESAEAQTEKQPDPVSVPNVKYESEVKVEDLPF